MRGLRWTLLIACCLAFVLFLGAVTYTAVADTSGEGGHKPSCAVMGGYAGWCTNNGKYAEGAIEGCMPDMEGHFHFAVIGASAHGGQLRYILHLPHYDKEEFWFGSRDHSEEWKNGKTMYGTHVTWSIVRAPGSPTAWIQRAWVRCCNCDEKRKAGVRHVEAGRL